MHNRRRKRNYSCVVNLNNYKNYFGLAGFEPAASWSRTKHASQLRYSPNIALLLYK